MVGEKTLKCN